MAFYVSKEQELKIKIRVPFTVYFIWKDPEYGKYRLVVRETSYPFEKDNPYYFRII